MKAYDGISKHSAIVAIAMVVIAGLIGFILIRERENSNNQLPALFLPLLHQ